MGTGNRHRHSNIIENFRKVIKMDNLIKIIEITWDLFRSISLPITFNGSTYNITLYGILIYTTIGLIIAALAFSFFK